MTALRVRCWLVGGLVFAAASTQIGAQTAFNSVVTHSALPENVNLASFPSPSAATPAANRTIMIKLLTNHPGVGAAGPMFEVRRASGQSAYVQADQAADSDDAVLEPPLSTPVASVLAFTASGGAPCPATTVAPGYRMMCIVVDFDPSYAFSAAETWVLRVERHSTGDYEYFGIAGNVPLADTIAAEAPVTAPKLWAQAELAFGDVQKSIILTSAPVLAPAVRNIGTAPLNITAGPIVNDPAPTFFTRPVFTPAPIEPGGSLVNNFDAGQGIWVQAAPSALGARTASLNVTAGSEIAPVTLTATGVTYYGHMLLDCSGSMRDKTDASPTSVEEESRLYLAKQPAKEVLNWVDGFTTGQGFLGLSTFPACGSLTTQVPGQIDIVANTRSTITALLGSSGGLGLKPGGWTPMQSGIEAAVQDMKSRIENPSLPPYVADRPNLRQTILMLSDGEETHGSAALTIPSLVTNGIRMYTIGYGDPDAGTNFSLLGELAQETGGRFWDSNALDILDLRNAYKNAIREWLGLESLVDPAGLIRAGQERQHKVCVDDRAYGLTFVADWDRAATGGINFTLVSPTGEVITPATSGISYYSDRMFAQYVIRGNRVRGGAGAGEWTLNLTGGSSIPSGQDTRYSYGAMAQTSIKVVPVIKGDRWTGGTRLLEVQLVNWGPPVVGTGGVTPTTPGGVKPTPGPSPTPVGPTTAPVITVHIDAPAASFGTWLATSDVQREWFFAAKPPIRTGSRSSPVNLLYAQAGQETTTRARTAPNPIEGEPATIAQRKAWAITNIGKRPFDDSRSRTSLRMYDDGTHGDRVAFDNIYTAEAPAYRYDGTYRFAFDVKTPGVSRRTCVERDIRVNELVVARLTPPLIRENIAWHAKYDVDLFFDPHVPELLPRREVPPGFKRSVAVFTPKDSLGNHWGPGRASVIQFSARNAKLIGPVIDNWDGSYLQVLEHRSNDGPIIAVNAAGVRSEPLELRDGGLPWWVWFVIAAIALLLLVVAIRRSQRA